jgi:hypothetical protein
MPRTTPFHAAVARVLVTAALVGGCVGRVVPVPIAVDHPANPSASSGSFTPQRPAFSIEPPTSDRAGTQDHGSHGTRETPAQPAPGDSTHRRHGGVDEGHAGHGGAKTTPTNESASSGDQARIDETVRAYLAVSRALAADDAAAAAGHAKHFRMSAEELSRAQDAGLREAGSSLAKSGDAAPTDIAAVRAAFKAWSPTVIDLVSRTPQSAQAVASLRVVRCPMADASWLQDSDDVANPYYGAKMLRCGSVTKVIEGRKGPAK